MSGLVRAAGQVLVVCLAVRLAAWLVTPVLPTVVAVLMFIVVGAWLLSGGRSSHWDGFRRR